MSKLHSKKLVLQSMMFKQPHKGYEGNLHPESVNRLIKKTKRPEPLTFKLHPIQTPISLLKPHQPPLGPVEPLPFHIERSLSGNLPVYSDYKNQHEIKRTVVRKITGDVLVVAEQLKKICSNADVNIKAGKVVIKGLHCQSIETWLLRLGL